MNQKQVIEQQTNTKTEENGTENLILVVNEGGGEDGDLQQNREQKDSQNQMELSQVLFEPNGRLAIQPISTSPPPSNGSTDSKDEGIGNRQFSTININSTFNTSQMIEAPIFSPTDIEKLKISNEFYDSRDSISNMSQLNNRNQSFRNSINFQKQKKFQSIRDNFQKTFFKPSNVSENVVSTQKNPQPTAQVNTKKEDQEDDNRTRERTKNVIEEVVEDNVRDRRNAVQQNHLPSEDGDSVKQKQQFNRKVKIWKLIQGNQDISAAEKEIQESQSIYRISEPFSNFFQQKEFLGEGCVGLVKRYIKQSDGIEYAVKMVRNREQQTIQNIKKEFLNLQKLNHPSIVKVYEIYIDNNQGEVYTVMQLVQGREMFNVLTELKGYTEQKAAQIFYKILDGILYMHSQFCVHRDLQPHNILCNDDGTMVKITDFNVSKFSDDYQDLPKESSEIDHIKMLTYTGTVAYSAPEILSGDVYDERVDMWSAGVVLYTMLVGREPFHSQYMGSLIAKITQGAYSYPEDSQKCISDEAKDLIAKLLTLNPEERLSPGAALQHEWFIQYSVIENSTDEMGTSIEEQDKILQRDSPQSEESKQQSSIEIDFNLAISNFSPQISNQYKPRSSVIFENFSLNNGKEQEKEENSSFKISQLRGSKPKPVQRKVFNQSNIFQTNTDYRFFKGKSHTMVIQHQPELNSTQNRLQNNFANLVKNQKNNSSTSSNDSKQQVLDILLRRNTYCQSKDGPEQRNSACDFISDNSNDQFEMYLEVNSQIKKTMSENSNEKHFVFNQDYPTQKYLSPQLNAQNQTQVNVPSFQAMGNQEMYFLNGSQMLRSNSIDLTKSFQTSDPQSPNTQDKGSNETSTELSGSGRLRQLTEVSVKQQSADDN